MTKNVNQSAQRAILASVIKQPFHLLHGRGSECVAEPRASASGPERMARLFRDSFATGRAGLNGSVTSTAANWGTVRATVFGELADVENRRLDWESQTRPKGYERDSANLEFWFRLQK
jgi:hypothetical protein